jgi:hypothetical protein
MEYLEDANADYEEASTLGFKPGQWPSFFEHDGHWFVQVESRWFKDQLLNVRYEADGYVLIVIND